MAETERLLLNHYNLTTLYPSEWPQEKDEADDADTEDAAPTAKEKSREKYKSRYINLERSATLRSKLPGSEAGRTGPGNLVNKDEPDPLGTSDSVVQVLRRRGLPVEEDLKLRNQFLLSSTTFSPSRYLSEVHTDDSTDDLLRGLDFLSRSIEKKSASLKVLVESNFERFVRAKATIDNVYKEMRNHGVDPDAERKPHSRQTSRNQTHWRSASGTLSPVSTLNKTPANDKRKNALIKESEYGVQGIKAPLVEVSVKAEEVWGPALGGREREESLKAVLASIDKNRAIFDTGVSIEDNIKNRDYEALAEAYSRAQKHVQEAKTLADRAKQNQVRLTDAQVHQIIITSRVWMDIQSRVEDFKREVWSRLISDHSSLSTPVHEQSDEYMDLIAVLLQLGVQENPITVWLQSHHDHLMNKITSSFERIRIELEISRRRLVSGGRPSAKILASHLKAAGTIGRNDNFDDLDTPPVIRFWEKICESLTSVLSVGPGGLLAEAVEFLETTQAFIDGKKQKSLPIGIDGQSRKHHKLTDEEVFRLQRSPPTLFALFREQLHGLFMEVPIDDISQLFTPIPATPQTPQSASLTPSRAKFHFKAENIPPPSPKTGETWEKFAFWPPYSNSLSAATFLGKLLNIIATAAGEIASIESAKQDTGLITQFRNLVGDVRERSITAVCAAWLVDSENSRELEDWTRSPEKRDLTNMPAYFTAFESSMLSSLQKIVYLTDVSGGPGTGSVVLPPPQRHIETVQKTFRNSLYKSFSGMMEHAGKPVRSPGGALEEDGGLAQPANGEASGQISGNDVDASNVNVRKLLTMSNFQALRNDVIPNLVSQFESNFTLTIGDDAKTARDVLAQMNSRVFKGYVRPTVEVLEGIIAAGVSDPNYAVANGDARPSDAKPYIYDVLLTLVLAHTEVSRTAPSLTTQVLSYLLEQISSSLIENFRKRKESFTLTALIQATLDVEFMAQTLNNYTTEKASEIQGKIYLALDERTDNDARTSLQKELPEMRSVLKRLREGTKGEFACFKRERRAKDKDKEKEKERPKS